MFDAIRKVITLVARVCDGLRMSEWRQSAYNLRKLKRLYRTAQSLKRSRAKKKEKVEEKRARIAKAHRQYIAQAEAYLEKVRGTLDVLLSTNRLSVITYDTIKHYMRHAERQIDQIRRRVLGGEKIPHSEKIFSIFEEHTEWISKGMSCFKRNWNFSLFMLALYQCGGKHDKEEEFQSGTKSCHH